MTRLFVQPGSILPPKPSWDGTKQFARPVQVQRNPDGTHKSPANPNSSSFDFSAIEQIAQGVEKMVLSWSSEKEERANLYAKAYDSMAATQGGPSEDGSSVPSNDEDFNDPDYYDDAPDSVNVQCNGAEDGRESPQQEEEEADEDQCHLNVNTNDLRPVGDSCSDQWDAGHEEAEESDRCGSNQVPVDRCASSQSVKYDEERDTPDFVIVSERMSEVADQDQYVLQQQHEAVVENISLGSLIADRETDLLTARENDLATPAGDCDNDDGFGSSFDDDEDRGPNESVADTDSHDLLQDPEVNGDDDNSESKESVELVNEGADVKENGDPYTGDMDDSQEEGTVGGNLRHDLPEDDGHIFRKDDYVDFREDESQCKNKLNEDADLQELEPENGSSDTSNMVGMGSADQNEIEECCPPINNVAESVHGANDAKRVDKITAPSRRSSVLTKSQKAAKSMSKARSAVDAATRKASKNSSRREELQRKRAGSGSISSRSSSSRSLIISGPKKKMKSTDNYRARVLELQISLEECAAEYEVKIVEMKMKMLQMKSECRQKEMECASKASVITESESDISVKSLVSSQVEDLRKQLFKIQREKAYYARELAELKRRERQFELQSRSLEDTVHLVNTLQRQLARRQQEVVDCQIREKELRSQLNEIQVAVQETRNNQASPEKLVTLLFALRQWSHSVKNGIMSCQIERLSKSKANNSKDGRLPRRRGMELENLQPGSVDLEEITQVVHKEIKSLHHLLTQINSSKKAAFK